MIRFLSREWARTMPRLPEWSRQVKQQPRAFASALLDRALGRPNDGQLPAPRDESLIRRHGMSIRIASTPDSIGPLVRLVHRKYSQRGYVAPQPCPKPATTRTIALEARTLDRCVGTLSIRLDSADRLSADAAFGEELEHLREPGRLLCEFGLLALDLRSGSTKEALALLFHVGYVIAYRIHHASHLVVEVNPRHVSFYRRRLGFAIAGEQRNCPRVGAPAVLLYRTLQTLAGDVVRFAGLPHRGNTSFYARGLAPWEEAELVVAVSRQLAALKAAEQLPATP